MVNLDSSIYIDQNTLPNTQVFQNDTIPNFGIARFSETYRNIYDLSTQWHIEVSFQWSIRILYAKRK